MIATKESLEPQSSEQLPNSQRVYVEGKLHPDLRVPMREVQLAPTQSFNGQVEVNEPVRLYDTSGPWGDPEFKLEVERGLPPLRRGWILRRGDVEEYEGREVEPQDNGYLSATHEKAAWLRSNPKSEIRSPKFPKRRPLRASKGHPVTQLWYARQGIITPEMEFIAIRENMRIADCGLRIAELGDDIVRNDLN